MGLKCSVLGHRFDEPGLVHEREPRGDEVITIRRKVVVCTICGEQRVLAENKEITKDIDEDDNTNDINDATVDDGDSTHESDNRENSTDETDNTIDENIGDTMSEIDDEGGVRTNEINDEMDASNDISTGEQREDGASIVDGTASEESGIRGIDVIHEQGVDTTESSGDARQDDGIVLTDDEGGREYGEWPDDSDETGADDQWEPDALRGSSVFGPSDTEKNSDTGYSPIDTETDTGEIITDEESNGKTTTETPETDEHTVESFCCPSCGFTVTAPDSPFRSGDSCPRCRKEYLIGEG
jgi:hypothetical protein